MPTNRLGSIAKASCVTGYWFPDKSKSYTMECLHSGNWSRQVEVCSCVFHSYAKFLFIIGVQETAKQMRQYNDVL